jgi:hypothetical protein
MFLVITALCVWLGVEVSAARQKQRAIFTIERLGGSIVYDYQWGKNGAWLANAKPPGLGFVKALLGENYRAEPVEIQFFKDPGMAPDRFTDVEAEQLQCFSKLEWLVLMDTKVTDAGLTHIAALRNLGRLDLEGSRVTPDGVRRIKAALPQARVYSDYPEVDDESTPSAKR